MLARLTETSIGSRARAAISGLPLFWQVFLPNAVVLAIAVAVLAFLPVGVSREFSWEQAVALLAILAAMTLVNVVLIRRAVSPLERLTTAMASVDPVRPGRRVVVEGGAETAELASVFNQMATRLERERRESGRLMLSAQERERVRLARELHDEIGQSLTALMLELDHASRQAPPEVAAELARARETARGLSDEVRAIVRRLRPEALDDLGLRSALSSLARGFTAQAEVSLVQGIDPDLPELGPEAELVIYRVAQEALTNVARHSGATRVLFRLRRTDDGVRLLVADDGTGLEGSEPRSGQQGMLERALLIDADLQLGPSELGGTEVRLDVPLREAA
jgi:two-component system, NarL family, sensor histidine kinase UhpB